MSKASTRITAFVPEGLAEMFTELTRGIGISGTALLSRTLPSELNHLAGLPTNSERAEMARQMMDRILEIDATHLKTRRFNITLIREDAERMNTLCREKRVPRDSFIGAYIYFLVKGEEGVCRGPLERIGEMLMNPRREYDEFLLNASLLRDEDEEDSPTNPYIDLHLDEATVDFFLERWKNRTPENK
jgi:hypothetical protein